MKKELEVVNGGNHQPYPMYFSLKGKDGGTFQQPAVREDGQQLYRDQKPVKDNFANGTSKLTVAHTDKLEVGDSIEIMTVKHTIEQIIECRPAKGRRFPTGTLWYNLVASYCRFTGQTR